MPFEPGRSGNPKGKKPGTLSKNNEQLRECLRQFLSANIESLQTSFDSLKKPELKIRFIIDMWKLLLPEPVNLLKLSPDDLQELYEFIKSQINETRSIEVN